MKLPNGYGSVVKLDVYKRQVLHFKIAHFFRKSKNFQA